MIASDAFSSPVGGPAHAFRAPMYAPDASAERWQVKGEAR